MNENGAVESEQIDWDHVFDLNFDFFDETAAEELYFNPAPDSRPLLVEQFPLNDNSNQVELFNADEFLSEVLLDSPAESGSDQAGEVIDVPKAKDLEGHEEDEADVPPAENNVVHVVNDDDPIVKKRKRQMRNRDAAVQSRERKKMYVRDLEMKSKYYEAECKRLGMLLQCCLADNQALRLSLHNNKAFDASRTRQESAVLSLESLLLGSLLWFLGIICLLILPGQLKSNLEAVLVGNVDSKEQGNASPRKMGIEVFSVPEFQSFMMGKRCKASRSRIKQALVAFA
ncbi:bZIP transcription factor 60 [Abeliophyllum distichum]|uniref:BZIP transcription factor 60 n=1 Tax=Abeliophyllum distichum TaxID=126358 RepID=A0ABD1T017_9LAMI